MLWHNFELTVSVRIISISVEADNDGNGNELDGDIDNGGATAPLVSMQAIPSKLTAASKKQCKQIAVA